jgi:hypothetical protein
MASPVRLVTAAGVLVAAIALRAAIGPGYLGYDAAWSLLWGAELAHGHLPDYQVVFAPTPHPLANLMAVPLSRLADGGVTALLAISYLSFAALLAGVVAIGVRVGGWLAGIAAAAFIASFDVLQREAAFASVDVPFLALVAWAGALEVARPRRGWPVVLLLAAAGLLRPEAWLLTVVYLAWLTPSRWTAATIALALASPVLWAGSDLLVTGNPVYSLTGTQALAADLARPTGVRTAITALPSSLESLLGAPLLAAGLLGLLAGAILAPGRFAGPLVVVALGIVSFVLLGVASLPVLLRYVLLPACGLVLAAALALTINRGRAGTAASLAVAILVIAAIPGRIEQFNSGRSFTRARHAVNHDLLAVVRSPAFRTAADRCPVTRVPDFRARPVIGLAAAIAPRAAEVGNLADGEPGLVITPASDAVAAAFTLNARGAVRRQAAPLNARTVVRNDSWIVYATC